MKIKLIALFLISLVFLFFSYESLGKKEEKITLESFIKQYTAETLDKYSEEIEATRKKLGEFIEIEGTPLEKKKPTIQERIKHALNKQPIAIASLTTAIMSLLLFIFMGKGKQCQSCKKYNLNRGKFCSHCGEKF